MDTCWICFQVVFLGRALKIPTNPKEITQVVLDPSKGHSQSVLISRLGSSNFKSSWETCGSGILRSSKTPCYRTPRCGLSPSCFASLCFSCLSFLSQHMPSSKEAAGGSAPLQSSTRFKRWQLWFQSSPHFYSRISPKPVVSEDKDLRLSTNDYSLCLSTCPTFSSLLYFCFSCCTTPTTSLRRKERKNEEKSPRVQGRGDHGAVSCWTQYQENAQNPYFQ